jgi:hypothetical protein
MEFNLKHDNKTELNKIFLVYASLDMQAQAQQVYLDFMINEHAPNAYGQWKPVVIEENDLPALQTFFTEIFIPACTEMIAKEVRIGVPSGRIVDIMGHDLRFVTSFQLIQRFLTEHYNILIREFLNRESILSKPNGDFLLLRSV